MDVLVEQLLGLAANEPALVVLEDAHWADPTSFEFVEQCMGEIVDRRLLMVVTSRPDPQPQLVSHPHLTRLALNRLGRGGVEAIVARLGGDHLPRETINTIIARTDGVPLFVEELTKAVLETGETAVPSSLHDSLMARLDRIPDARDLAQIASCIGREFSFALLAEVADQPQPDLRAALNLLENEELVFRRGSPPDAAYSFKHALVQDAAYRSLLRSRRQQLHARLAAILERRFAAEAEPELLAHHYGIAGKTDVAVGYW